MNQKAKLFVEPYGRKDKEGRKLIYLRVYWRGQSNRYTSGSTIHLSKEQFENTRLKITATALEEIRPNVKAAEQIIDELGSGFSFVIFKQRYHRAIYGHQENDSLTIVGAAESYYENRAIATKTRASYTIAVNWMLRYAGNIRLAEITAETLHGYVAFMKRTHQKEDLNRQIKRGEQNPVIHEMSENSVRMNLRAIRAIYNYGVKKAKLQLSNPFHELDNQPTGSIPREKEALQADELQRLIQYQPADKKEEFSKDFFLLTVQMSGANIGDILSLRNKNIHGDEIWFIRRKTRRSGIITKIPFTSFAREIMTKYGRINPAAPENYILPFLYGATTEKLYLSRIHDFGTKINAGLRSIASSLGMDSFTTIIGRHSFSVYSASNGFTVEQIQHFLGHASPNTTKNYLKSIDTGVLRKSATLLESMMAPQTEPSEPSQPDPGEK